MFSYIKYFFYLGFNWNFRIAFYIVKNEVRGERKYHIKTTGADELQHLEERGIDISHSTIYMPVNYGILEMAFAQVDIASCKHFLDIGCGKGRALCVAAHYGAKKVTGLDFSASLCTDAEKNLSLVQQQFPSLEYDVINNDAFYYHIPSDVDLIFLFNPFDEVIMSGVAENIQMSFEANPRHITIIYVNPQCKQELLDVGFKETWHVQKLKYLEASVLKKISQLTLRSCL